MNCIAPQASVLGYQLWKTCVGVSLHLCSGVPYRVSNRQSSLNFPVTLVLFVVGKSGNNADFHSLHGKADVRVCGEAKIWRQERHEGAHLHVLLTSEDEADRVKVQLPAAQITMYMVGMLCNGKSHSMLCHQSLCCQAASHSRTCLLGASPAHIPLASTLHRLAPA